MASKRLGFGRFGSAAWWIVAPVLAGCGDPEKLNLAPQPLFPADAPVRAPEFGPRTSIRLRNGRDDVRVGGEAAEAARLFTQPKKSFELRELPTQFGDGFRVRGWESDAEGYGVISFDGRVALALRTLRNVDEERVIETIREAEYDLGRNAVTATGKTSRYWFWESQRDRKMVCAVEVKRGEFMLTLAIGELNVMDALRMAPAQAQKDAARSGAIASPIRPSK